MNIIWDYPFWVLLLCPLLGAAYTALLYFRNKDLDEIPVLYRNLAAGLRFITVTLVLLLLFSPLLRTIGKEKENPIIMVVQDNSESVRLNADSTFYGGNYKTELQSLRETLGESYETVFYTAGSKLLMDGTIDFSEKQTDYEQIFKELETVYAGRNIGAVVLAGDGLYNKGIHPAYRVKNLKTPVFSVALGDSSIQRDAYIRKVNANKIAYLNNKFPVEINIGADKLNGKVAAVRISTEGKTIFSQNVPINDNRFDATISLVLDADKAGTRRYTVNIAAIDGEHTLQNNTFPFYVEVMDGRRKILLLADGAHPDLGALMQAISVNENYEADLQYAADFNKRIEDYSLAILHQLPGQGSQIADITQRLDKANISTWYILGGRSNLFAFNQLDAGLKITGSGAKPDVVTPAINNGFGAFTISENLQKLLGKVPPVYTPFGNYEVKPGAEIFLFRKIGMAATQSPALLFYTEPRRRTAILAGEGIWRWGLEDYAQNQSRDLFNELISKTIQYLSVSEDKSRFRVSAKNLYSETENILIDAELYNESYEPVNTPEAKIILKDSDGKNYPYTFNKTANAYRLDAGKIASGEYSYHATTNLNGQPLEKKGQFTVSQTNLESLDTRANFSVMSRLADETDGEFFLADQLSLIPERIKAREDIRPLTYSTGKLKSLSDFKWIFFVILTSLAGEWFIRKYFGRY